MPAWRPKYWRFTVEHAIFLYHALLQVLSFHDGMVCPLSHSHVVFDCEDPYMNCADRYICDILAEIFLWIGNVFLVLSFAACAIGLANFLPNGVVWETVDARQPTVHIQRARLVSHFGQSLVRKMCSLISSDPRKGRELMNSCSYLTSGVPFFMHLGPSCELLVVSCCYLSRRYVRRITSRFWWVTGERATTKCECRARIDCHDSDYSMIILPRISSLHNSGTWLIVKSVWWYFNDYIVHHSSIFQNIGANNFDDIVLSAFVFHVFMCLWFAGHVCLGCRCSIVALFQYELIFSRNIYVLFLVGYLTGCFHFLCTW